MSHYSDTCECIGCAYLRKHPQLPRPSGRMIDVDKLEVGDVGVLYDGLPNNAELDVLQIPPDEAIEGGSTPALWKNVQQASAHHHADVRSSNGGGRFVVVMVVAVYDKP